jgi:membrane AbrB-like protein
VSAPDPARPPSPPAPSPGGGAASPPRRGVPWRRLLPTLALGAAGGFAFDLLGLPLAWMIGSMVVVMAAAMAGARVAVPPPLRQGMIAVLGIMLGSAFTPEILDRLDEWAVSLLALFAYIAASLAIGIAYLRRVAGYDPVTAFFTAAPGGFSEMVVTGGAMGGDERLISLSHSLRITTVVLIIPFFFQYALGYVPAGGGRSYGPPLLSLAPQDAALLAACGLGYWPARRLGLPAPQMFGPMLCSAAIHLAGLTASKPPGVVVAVAMVVVGSSIGARFTGVAPGALARAGAVSLGLTALLLGVTVAFAWGLHAATGIPLSSLVLGYAPGGFAEMSLVSLAMGLDPAFVSSHHMARIAIVIALVPPAFRLMRRLAGGGAVPPSGGGGGTGAGPGPT